MISSNGGTPRAGGLTAVGGGKLFKVIIVGNSNTGKTFLTHRFVHNTLPSGPQARQTTGVEFSKKDIVLEEGFGSLAEPQKRVLRISFCDTAG